MNINNDDITKYKRYILQQIYIKLSNILKDLELHIKDLENNKIYLSKINKMNENIYNINKNINSIYNNEINSNNFDIEEVILENISNDDNILKIYYEYQNHFKINYFKEIRQEIIDFVIKYGSLDLKTIDVFGFLNICEKSKKLLKK